MADEFKFPDEIDSEEKSEEIEIEIVDDTPERDKGRKPLEKAVEEPTDDELESYSDKVRNRIKELTHARHDERRVKESTMREKQELERMAQHLLDENRRLKGAVDNGSKHYAQTIKQAAEAEHEMVRRKYKEAYESGDTDAVLAAQEALTESKLKIQAANNFRPTSLQDQGDSVKIQQSAPEQVKPDDKTLRWQAKNQWFGTAGFEEVTSMALGLHQKLVNSGVDPRSDEYFEQIDARIKSKFPEVLGDEDRSKNSSKRPSSVVASASRSSGVKKVQLSSTAVALAKKFGLTPQQYAAQVAKLENSNG
jgi:hypothetical protein